ncbi:DoxX family membrane protein [Hoyosella rhizosphaerae]|uniref:Membrane protein n=1 Tax=Hoyosella rhizosphaerae TaxID=1755582 RepID=A0A916X7Q0_9ACTN|nr:DoxX family membrane protein [Hoyosella rhizosphaerae]MBN4927345.1 DoxX family membrane protein [Hoyosella rhizosphaerae]GGC51999.1 membrane protein [Hoyosella rhizosphaerae]
MTDKRDDAEASESNDETGAAPSPFDHETEQIPVGQPTESPAERTEAMNIADINAAGEAEDSAADSADTSPGFAWSRSPEYQPEPPTAAPSQHVTRGRPPRPSAANYDDAAPGFSSDAPESTTSAATEQIPVSASSEPAQAYSSRHTEILKRPDPSADGGFAYENTAPQYVASEYDAPPSQAFENYQQEYAQEPVMVPAAPPVEARRGTLDFGLFIMRLLIGGALITDGVRHLIGDGGGLGVDGFEALFASAGYDYANIVAISVLSAQIGGGALIVLGLATPLGAAVAFAAMINVWIAHQGARAALDGIGTPALELATILGIGAVALAFTGPGRMSLERNAKWAVRPRWGASVLIVLGLIGGIAAWVVLTGVFQ